MKKVIVGIDSKGTRTVKTVAADAKQIISNPTKFGFSKVSAVMTEEMFNKVMEA